MSSFFCSLVMFQLNCFPHHKLQRVISGLQRYYFVSWLLQLLITISPFQRAILIILTTKSQWIDIAEELNNFGLIISLSIDEIIIINRSNQNQISLQSPAFNCTVTKVNKDILKCNCNKLSGGIAVEVFLHKQPPEVFCKKAVLRNFTKFTGKHLCLGPANLF